MSYKEKYDFIERSREIISQYGTLRLSKKKMYDVTVLLNCCLGMLVYINEKFSTYIPRKIDGMDLIISGVSICKYKSMRDQNRSIKNICRHLRDSLSHGHFNIKTGSRNKISGIYFNNYVDWRECTEKQTFCLEINVDVFRQFVLDLSDKTIENYKNNSQNKIIN